MLFGVDVSVHQGSLNWAAVKADGMSFSVARATLGLQVDAEYAGKQSGAAKAGLLTGAYHYLWPGVDPVKAVDLFLKTVGTTDGKLLMLDVEDNGNQTDAQVYAAVKAWVAAFRKRLPKHPLLIYTGRWFWVGHMDNPSGVGFGPLWSSHYVGVANADSAYPWRSLWSTVPSSFWTGYGGWPKATFLQFTSSGKVDGYASRIDVSAFNGSMAALQGLAADDPNPTAPESDIDMPGLDIELFVTKDSDPYDNLYTAKLNTGSLLKVSDGSHVALPAGTDLGVVQSGQYNGSAIFALNHEGSQHIVARSNCSSLPLPRPATTGITQADVDKAEADATAAQKAADDAAIKAAQDAATAAADAQKAAEANAQVYEARAVAAEGDLDAAKQEAADADARAAEAKAALDEVGAAWKTLDTRLGA